MSSLLLEIPVSLAFPIADLLELIRHVEVEKRHNFLRICLSRRLQHNRRVLSALTSYSRSDSMMFVNSLLWCFRQMA